MIPHNVTSPDDTYVVISGPARTDPNVYKTLTILLLTLAVITLAVIQFCRRRHLPFQLPFKVCRESTAETAARTDSRRKRPRASVGSANFTSSETSRNTRRTHVQNEDVDEREVQANLLQEPNHVGEEHDRQIAMTSSQKITEDEKREEQALENAGLFDRSTVNCEDQTQQKLLRQERDGLDCTADSRVCDPLKKRHRRSGVCISMPCGNVLPESFKESTLPGDMDQTESLPQLQVNGIKCEVDAECSETESKHENDAEDVFDEGQIQCAVRFDDKSNVLLVHSVSVKANMDPGIPGFFVEVTLLPKETISAKSRVYVTANAKVDLTLRETFQLNCTRTDFDSNSLFLAVKPMYSGSVLYAETDLKDLSLRSDRDIFLGGYMKSLSVHLS